MTTIHSHRREPTPTAVFDTYWRFAAERHAIYLRRLHDEMVINAKCEACGDPPLRSVNGRGKCPHRVQILALTTDPILQTYRFTNCFRAADRVSQYLIRNVIYLGSNDPREIIFRTLLFKIFNKISTWELLRRQLDVMPMRRDGLSIGVVLDEAKAASETLYSAAYVMPSPGNAAVKHRAHLSILYKVVAAWEKIIAAKSLQALYEVLLTVPSFGPFLAYQFAIDLNYSDVVNFDEDEFVVPGPGAKDGIAKCFSDLGDYSEADVIRWTCDRQEEEFERRALPPVRLFGRHLRLIDCQNLYCEISKYARVAHPDVSGIAGRTKIKQHYTSNPQPMPMPFFPPKWRLVVPAQLRPLSYP